MHLVKYNILALVAILTLVVAPLQPIFAQGPLYFFWEQPELPEPTPPLVTTANMSLSTIPQGLDTKYETFQLTCSNDQVVESKLIVTHTDTAGNTVKIYCQWNPWLPEGAKQYTAFYNDKIIVGLCPYDEAANRHDIFIDEDGEISRVHWLSVRTNGSDYVIYNNYFG